MKKSKAAKAKPVRNLPAKRLSAGLDGQTRREDRHGREEEGEDPKSMRSLPAKAISAKSAKGVKGGSAPKQPDYPKESLTLNYDKIKYEY